MGWETGPQKFRLTVQTKPAKGFRRATVTDGGVGLMLRTGGAVYTLINSQSLWLRDHFTGQTTLYFKIDEL